MDIDEAAIRELHSPRRRVPRVEIEQGYGPMNQYRVGGEVSVRECAHCGTDYPCDTIEALDEKGTF